jgi:hypothetical protein
MYFDNDNPLDFGIDYALDAMQEGRERVNSFAYQFSFDNEVGLPSLHSDMQFEAVCPYLLSTSFPYSSGNSASTHYEELEEDPTPIPSKSTRDETRPPSYFYSIPQHLPAKQIGSLTAEQRLSKIKRYKEKRERRVWSKKINYCCRKRVADNRLRVKGRFVTKEQAKTLSGSGDANSA